MTPKVYLSYQRQAWFDPNDGGFRMTLDWDIRYRTVDLDLCADTDGRRILDPEYSLLEVKASGGIPLWLMELLSQLKLHKISFSKYGRAYEELLQESRGHTYA